MIKSFHYAIEGIVLGYRQERNMRIHFLATAVVVIAGFYYDVSNVEWFALLMMIGLVISFELFNTAIESIVDLIVDDFHPLAKVAKDTAAGSVMIMSIVAMIIGMIIFIPKIF